MSDLKNVIKKLAKSADFDNSINRGIVISVDKNTATW